MPVDRVPSHGLSFAAAALAMLVGLDPVAAPAQPAGGYAKPASPVAGARADAREVFVATVHLDGNANAKGDARHPAEPFPSATLPTGGGLLLTPPADDGAWRVRAFLFEPRQVVVYQGDPVTLTFVGVQGPSHRIEVDGHGAIVELKRGETKSVVIPAAEPGVVGFRSLDRLPSMQGSVIVLPRP